MTDKELSFEDQMDNLEQIVNKLEKGDVPLEKALTEFEKGMKLSQNLSNMLANAEKTLTKVVDDQGNEKLFEKEDSNE